MSEEEINAHHKAENSELRETSGRVRIESKLTSFLYELMRDHVNIGTVQHVLQNSTMDADVTYSNGFLAQYADYVAKKLTS